MRQAPRRQVNELVEHLFRHRAGQMLAALTRAFGLENLDLAEEVAQEAMLQALRQWPFRGVPEDPGGRLSRGPGRGAQRNRAALPPAAAHFPGTSRNTTGLARAGTASLTK